MRDGLGRVPRILRTQRSGRRRPKRGISQCAGALWRRGEALRRRDSRTGEHGRVARRGNGRLSVIERGPEFAVLARAVLVFCLLLSETRVLLGGSYLLLGRGLSRRAIDPPLKLTLFTVV